MSDYTEFLLPNNNNIVDYCTKIINSFSYEEKYKYKHQPRWICSKLSENNIFPELTIIDPYILYITQHVALIMNQYGFNVVNCPLEDDIIVEIHCKHAQNKYIASHFDIHQDNDGVLSCKEHTLICYLENSCNGGELAIYSGDDESLLVTLLETKSNDDFFKKIIILNGNTYHKPMPIKNGNRICIVFHIKQS